MNVGISLVSMDRPQTLRQTITRLTCNLRIEPKSVVLVDNGSTDPETLELLKTQAAEGWVVVHNEVNTGLSRAVNLGLELLVRTGNFDILVHLDDDALVLSDDWLPRVVDTMINCPELGLLVPNASHYTEFIPHDRYKELRWGLGFFWALRREAYTAVGGYDSTLLHQQECDLALRVRMAGYTVGVIDIHVKHNETRPAPDESWRQTGALPTVAQAREHLGCVMFRDKWIRFFLGKNFDYGTVPLALMTHFPPDQDWYRRYAEAHNVDLNPDCPEARLDLSPGQVLGVTADNVRTLPRRITVGGQPYTLFVSLRGDIAHWYRGNGYASDRQLAIDNWFALTGERYEGYPWPNVLRPAE